MTSIAILGANGRLSRQVAKAFLGAGYTTISVTRTGKVAAELKGAEGRAADALDRDALIAATKGADIIFNGLNPIYTDWQTMCPPMAENVIAACIAHGAAHFFPGNVYNFGSPMPVELREDSPFEPTSRKGKIRVEMERRFEGAAHEQGIATLVLRAGDFFGGSGTGSWFDLVVSSKLKKGAYTAPGPVDLVHEWAYLADFAAAFVKLASVRDRLGQYENLHFPGHAVTDLEIRDAAEQALGRPLKISQFPWWVLKTGGIIVPMWREIAEMSYLRFEPHRLVSARLESLIGEIPHTPLDIAVRDALDDLGLLPAEISKRAAWPVQILPSRMRTRRITRIRPTPPDGP